MIDNRPVYKGLPVPYVTRWTGDRTTTQYRIGYEMELFVAPTGGRKPTPRIVGQYLSFPDEVPSDRVLGALWQRETETETGQPEFSQVSTPRQRRCMIENLCQVCGDPLGDGPFHWLMPSPQFTRLVTHGDTIAPPVCEDCANRAASWCPALTRQGFERLLVQAMTPVAILGEWAHIDAQGEIRRGRGDCRLDNAEHLTMHVAKQLVVELHNWKVVL